MAPSGRGNKKLPLPVSTCEQGKETALCTLTLARNIPRARGEKTFVEELFIRKGFVMHRPIRRSKELSIATQLPLDRMTTRHVR
jgi:hypothetical protein